MKNKKRNILILAPITFLLFSCSNAEESQVGKQENLGFEDIPNAKTKRISIATKNMPDQHDLMKNLKAKLEKNEFNFEERESKGGSGFTNCEENTIISVKGKGIRSYFARSRKPEKNTEDFYPDFIIQVFEFPNEKIAQEKFEIMDKALHSDGRFCNGKAPEVLVINNNEVFQFSTRAEMFRGYINEYSEFVQKQ